MRSRPSKIVTLKPRCRRTSAHRRPATPAPTIPMCGRIEEGIMRSYFISETTKDNEQLLNILGLHGHLSPNELTSRIGARQNERNLPQDCFLWSESSSYSLQIDRCSNEKKLNPDRVWRKFCTRCKRLHVYPSRLYEAFFLSSGPDTGA